MKTLFTFWLLLLATVALGGDAVIFSGNDVLTLKDNISLNRKAHILTGTVDPSAVATAGEQGSVYLRTGPTGGGFYVKQDAGTTTNWTNTLTPGGGTPLTPTYYDATGVLASIPGYSITTEFGWGVSQSVDVLAQSFDNHNLNVIPTTPTTGIFRTAEAYTVFVDPTNTGIQIGDASGGGVSAQNLNLDHSAAGVVGNLGISNGFSNLGDGTGGTLSNFSTYTHGAHINPNYSINQYSAFGDFPQFDAGSTLGSLNAYSFSPAFNGAITGFATPISVFPNFGAASTTAHYHGMELGGDANTTGVVTEYLGTNVYLNNATSTDYKLYNGFPTGVTATNLNLLNLGISNSAVQNLTFASFNANTTTAQNVTGVNIDMSGVTSPGQKSALKTNDGATQLQSNWDTGVLPQPGGEFQLNLIGGTYHVAAGFPITDGSFGFGNNIGPTILIEDDVSVDTTGVNLGFSVNGLVNQTSVVAGKTLPDLNYMTAGAGIPPTSTGGNITSARMFRALGFLPSGGTLNITNLYGLQVDPLMDAVGATNEWGVWVGATSADNWFSKNVVISGSTGKPTNSSAGLEISGTTKALLHSRLTTAQRLALTAVNGMQVYDTDLDTFQCYAAGAWVDCGTSTALSSDFFVATAGQNLTVCENIYISVGAGNGDTGRTQGQVYELEVDGANPLRLEYAGKVTSSVTSGAPAIIQTNGVITGCSGYSTGDKQFADVATPGVDTNVAPSAPGSYIQQTCIANSTTSCVINGAGSATSLAFTGGAPGTVTSVNGTPGNGFTLNFSNPTSTPVGTVGTSITGILHGNGTAVAAATATDLTFACSAVGTNLDWSTSNCFTKTLAANTTFTFSNTAAGEVVIFRLANSGAFTSTFPAVTWTSNGGNPPAVSALAIITLFNDGTNIYGSDGTSAGPFTVNQSTLAPTAVAAVNIDWSTSNTFTKTLSANSTFTFSNVKAGQTIIIQVTNTASNFTLAWPATVKWPGGTTPTLTVGAKHDDFTCVSFDGTNSDCSAVQNF